MKIKKLIIVLGCCIITLYSLVFVGCKREKANASIYSQSVLIGLPSFAINIDNGVGYVPTMYFGYDTNYYVYYPRSSTGAEFYYYKGYNGNIEFPHYVYGLNQTNNVTINRYSDLSLVGGSNLSVFMYDNNTGLYTWEYILNNATHINIEYSLNNLDYKFYDINDFVIARIRFGNCKLSENPTINENYSVSLISTNILLDQEVLLDNAYNNGYNDAYNIGYNTGYNVGLNDGYGATTPFDIVSNSISDLLDIELFGSFKISSLLYISFGMILLGIVIKVFLGG